MTSRTLAGIVLLVLPIGLVGCDANSGSPPTAPSRAPTSPAPTTSTLFMFTEARTGFSKSEVRDVQEQILQFNPPTELIWTADGTRLPGYRVGMNNFGDTPTYYIEGKICTEGCAFVVRFGTRDGERRAYLTVDYGHDNPGTLVDVEVADNALVVTQSSVFPPGSPTLSGLVTETTPTGQAPIEGVAVYRGVQTGWRAATTDQNGFYRILGLYDGIDTVATRKEGYQESKKEASIDGDTRFDIELVRR
jgi:hypothetical protein